MLRLEKNMGFLLDSNCVEMLRWENEMVFLLDSKSVERLIKEQQLNGFILDSNNVEISENGFLTWQRKCWKTDIRTMKRFHTWQQ